jgi:formate dehydrogenase major subunit
VAGLAPTFGRGAMTNHWVDIKNADVVMVMGGNPAEAHPCGFKWVIEAKIKNKATLVVVDPRFTRTAAVADVYAPIRAGSDIAFLAGLANYLLQKDLVQHEYVKAYTNASYIVRQDYGFDDGLFTGYDEAKRSYDKTTWAYELDKDGFAKVDETLQDPRCVYQLLKGHFSRYTPEKVEEICGTPKAQFLKICEIVGSTSSPAKVMTHLYALGWTQHSQGSQMIRTMAMIQLLLGNMGMPGGGMNALRGHSNIQGLTDLGLLSHLLPGYLTIPTEADTDYATYLEKRIPKPLRPGQMNYLSNYGKFFVSLQKAWWGAAATKENDWAFGYLPKIDGGYDVLRVFENMAQGKMNGYICQGFNPLASFPDKAKLIKALSSLKFLVSIDPLATETASFWENHGEYNDVDPATIQTEVFRLPSTCFAEEDGSLVNSGRWLQWHWKAADPPGDAKGDQEIVGELFTRIRDLYRKEGGTFPDPILNLTWAYKQPASPSPEELAKEFNGVALADVPDPKDPTKFLAKEGEQLPGFGALRDDGTTASGCWIFAGAWTQNGNQMARRDASDPTGLGATGGWAWAWPANRRILYNRASADPAGKPWSPKKKYMTWNGAKWVGPDVPDMRPDAAPQENVGPFIMNAEGVARLWAPGLTDGPFPEHYEPFETPLARNPIGTKVLSNPVARVYPSDREKFGTAKEFPYVATTYRLTEHFHFWTKHTRIGAVLQPEQFVEISEGLAKKKGIANGDRVVVRSKRGKITAKAVVTKRMPTLKAGGQEVETVGIPIHWGFLGQARKGYLTNTLTPTVGDANIQTPEYKAFLVDIEKAPAGQA